MGGSFQAIESLSIAFQLLLSHFEHLGSISNVLQYIYFQIFQYIFIIFTLSPVLKEQLQLQLLTPSHAISRPLPFQPSMQANLGDTKPLLRQYSARMLSVEEACPVHHPANKD